LGGKVNLRCISTRGMIFLAASSRVVYIEFGLLLRFSTERFL
jgi:hypothetical protein